MGKGSWRRPTGPDFDENYCRTFPNARGCREAAINAALDEQDRQKVERAERAQRVMNQPRYIALTLDELRSVVFETSVAYASQLTRKNSTQESEWARAAALKAALERLGFEREAEMIGGAA